MEKLNIEFHEYLFEMYIETSIILMSILFLEKIEIDICKKIDHFLYNLEEIIIYFES
jgi:hypothetical protein